MEIRKLLRAYGIRNFNLSNSTKIMVISISLILWHLTSGVPSYEPCVIYRLSSQMLIRYILKQDLPMSLEDSLTLAEAYKLPTLQINYLYLIMLIGQSKVCSSTWKYEIAWTKSFFLCFHDIRMQSILCCFLDGGKHDCAEEAVLCRGRVCDQAPHLLGKTAAGGQSPHIWWGEEREDVMRLKLNIICI